MLYALEGTFRKAGNKTPSTAQLIDAHRDTQTSEIIDLGLNPREDYCTNRLEIMSVTELDFVPELGHNTLISEYKRVLRELYSQGYKVASIGV